MSIRNLFLSVFAALALLLCALVLVIAMLTKTHRELAASEHQRYESFRLADELRQSSDDLTRMARTYVVTGNPIYEEYFWTILDIRNGVKPRPDNYGRVYWDLLRNGEKPRLDGLAVSLEQRMRDMNFTEAELGKLREAQAESDALVHLETVAMNAMKGQFDDGSGTFSTRRDPDPEMARGLMHEKAYHEAKARIMAPIGEFLSMLEARTTMEAETLERQVRRYIHMAWPLVLLSLVVCVASFLALKRRVITPVQRLVGHAQQLTRGNYAQHVQVDLCDELGELSQTFNVMAAAIEHDIGQRERFKEELRKARDAAEEANQAKSQFLANMSHELRTPLNAIIGYSEMLAEDAEETGRKDTVADLEKVQAAGRHLLALINDILDLSKVEAGKMELHVTRFDVAGLVGEVSGTVQPLLEKNATSLNVRCPKDLGEMNTDMTRLRQILFNLLSNAIKFSPRGSVTLEVARQAIDGVASMLFRISDTGIGMTADQLEHIFEPFTQADSSTTRKYGGTGLGLTICREFACAMGGDIEAESVQSKGSVFSVRLPVTRPPDTALQHVESSPRTHIPATPPEGGQVVLVVDDNPDVREIMSRIFEKDGYHVVTAASGEEGIARARESRPAAIILDVIMPGMDGWTVLSTLKGDPGLASIPVIITTMLDEQKMGYALGASDYLLKPVDRRQLMDTLRKHTSPSPPPTVLVVDDDRGARKMLTRTLRQSTCHVMEAENGRVALQRMKRHRTDLVLLDLMMPVMDGFEFIEEVRKQPQWRNLPIVVITAKDLSAEERARLNGEVEDIVNKSARSMSEFLLELRGMVKAHTQSPGTAQQQSLERERSNV